MHLTGRTGGLAKVHLVRYGFKDGGNGGASKHDEGYGRVFVGEFFAGNTAWADRRIMHGFHKPQVRVFLCATVGYRTSDIGMDESSWCRDDQEE